MARHYANIATAIWRPEDDFGDLTITAQWAYLMLVTQSDISAAGVLSLNVKRWVGRAKDGTRDAIVGAIQELQAAGKVVYDTDTEELLIRTFVKWDGGYSNRKRRPVILRAAGEVESLALRQVLAREFAKLELPVGVLRLPVTSGGDSLSGPYGIAHTVEPPNTIEPATAAPGPHTSENTFPQVDSLSDSPSRFDGVVVTQAVVVRPQPSTRNPQSVPPSAATAVAVAEPALFEGPRTDPAETPPTDHQRAFGIARWWIKTRAEKGTPVIAKGRHGPLHILKNLIEPFAEGRYTDDEIKQALEEISESVPSKSQMDRTLSKLRTGVPSNQQGRRNGALGHQPYRNPENQDDYNEWTVRR